MGEGEKETVACAIADLKRLRDLADEAASLSAIAGRMVSAAFTAGPAEWHDGKQVVRFPGASLSDILFIDAHASSYAEMVADQAEGLVP